MHLTYDYNNGNFVLEAPPREVDFVRQIPGLKYKHKVDRWVGPASWTAANVINAVLVPRGLQYDSAVQDRISRFAMHISSIYENKRSTGMELLPGRTGKRLFPWQSADVAALIGMKSGLDISDRGTGKGPKLLSTVRFLNALQADVFPLLIVSRPLMLETLREEALEWIPELEPEDVVVIPKGMTPGQRKKQFELNAKVYILPHHMLPMHSRIAAYGTNTVSEAQREPKELNNRFRSAIIDEAHRLINPDNISTRACWAILDELEYKFMATGSPVANDPSDLWALLRAIRPDEFGSSVKFKNRYCDMQDQFFGPPKCVGLRHDTEAEFRAIFAPVHVLRKKEDVLKDLPEKKYLTISSEMTGKQATCYKKLDDTGIVKVGDFVLTASGANLDEKLQQFSAGTPVLGEYIATDEDCTGYAVVTVKELTMPSVKVDALMETLEEYPGQLIVWMKSRPLLELCAKELDKAKISYVEFKGGMKDKVREAGRHTFQAGDARVALCMLQVASEGLTFTSAKTALYLQREDNMVNSTQSEDRIHRIGQTEECLIIDHITVGSNEAKVHANYLSKEAMSNKALGIERQQRAAN